MTGIAIGLGFIAGVAVGPLAMLVVAGLIVARLIWPGGRSLIVPALLVLLATGAGVLREASVTRPNNIWPADTAVVVGKVVSDPSGPESGLRFIVNVTGVKRANAWMAGSGRVCVTARTRQPVGFGDIVQLQGTPNSAANQSANVRDYLAGLDCGASMFTYTVWIERTGSGPRRLIGNFRRRIDDVLLAAAPGNSGALLAGLVTGNDWHLSPEHRQAFFDTGTSHITAVSGANLALLVTVLASIGGFIGGRRSVGWDIVLACIIILYAALTGFGAPVVRAAIVAILALVAARAGRKPDLATLLVVTAAVMLAVHPEYRSSLSFRLSFASSLALILTAQRTRPVGPAAWVGVGLLATAAAQLATLPLLPHHSGASPLAGIPANLIVELIVGIVYPLAWMIALVGLVSSPAAAIVVVPAHLLCLLAFGVVDLLAPIGRATTIGIGALLLGKLVAGTAAGGLTLLGADGQRTWRRLMMAPRRQFSELIALAVVAALFLAASLAVFAMLDP